MKTKTIKTAPSPILLAASCAVLLAVGGLASGAEYVAQSFTVGNSTAITIMHPVERQATVAIFPGRRVWSSQQRSARAEENTVHHAQAPDGGQITFFAPNR